MESWRELARRVWLDRSRPGATGAAGDDDPAGSASGGGTDAGAADAGGADGGGADGGGADAGRAVASGGVTVVSGAAVRPAGIERRAAPVAGGVPRWLQTGAAWSWRLLLIGAALYVMARIAGVLYIVVVPCAAALLLTALLQPLTARLRRAGLPGLAATWCTLLGAAAVLTGIFTLVANRVGADYPTLVSETKHTTKQVQSWLAGAPFHVKGSNVQNLLNDIPRFLSQHRSLVEGTVVTGGRIAVESLAGLVLMLFVTFFLLKDGERIWKWLISELSEPAARRADRAGRAAWHAVVYYMRGTVAVAAIHAVVIGIALWIMRVPLVIPLAVLIFLAAFVPMVGLLIAGALAIVVTLASKGWVDAVILLGVLVIEDQLEGHLLQPQVVGRAVRLHPLAIILALAVGSVVAGIPGAVVAVPIVAVITRAVPELRQQDEQLPELDITS
jgi:predicted PurR-regulated permease PerM